MIKGKCSQKYAGHNDSCQLCDISHRSKIQMLIFEGGVCWFLISISEPRRVDNKLFHRLHTICLGEKGVCSQALHWRKETSQVDVRVNFIHMW